MALPRIRGIGVPVVAAIAVSTAVAAPAIATPGLAPGISTYKTWRKGVYYLASSFNESRARLLYFASKLRAA